MLSLLAFVVAAQAPADIPLLSGVGVTGVSQGGGRAPAGADTVQAEIVAGKWQEPKAGDKIASPRGSERTWEAVTANKDGVFDGAPARGGYIDIGYDSDADKPMLLVAAGDTLVYINGVPRAGDPYGYGYLKIPFPLKKGHNEFLFLCGRGSLKATLSAPKAPVFIDTSDATLPDIVSGQSHSDLLGSITVVNCEDKPIKGLSITAASTDVPDAPSRSQVPPLGSYSSRKCNIVLLPSRDLYTLMTPPVDASVRLALRSSSGKETDVQTIKLRVRKPTEQYKRTFVSQIDGSVQYYAVCPALKPNPSNALIMTVHGASVEAIGQASAYAPKDWCTIVAPTNRRPYGFDWEDWGRMDAMEVWDIAKKEFLHDPKRVILTGHSMGGHGTWTLGLTYPNEFAAIGPSAGWISFWSYAGGWTPEDPTPVEAMIRRSMNSSDTLLMLNNAKMEDIFILHGDKDDNVPVEQAREMKQKLTDIGENFEYHEQPGAGHWWGNQCVDWPPMFDLFNKTRHGESATEVAEDAGTDGDHWTFTTVNPGVSPNCRDIQILEQINPLEPSSVDVRTNSKDIHITTKNVAAIQIGWTYRNLKQFIDGQPAPSRFARKIGDRWELFDTKLPEKTPRSTGPFKLAFQNRMVFVVGTHGTPEENEWSANKARYDAETWGYRANGAVDIVTDNEVGRYRDRNLILYGNADTNSAFKLIAKCPLQMKRGSIAIGGHTFTGDAQAALYLWPEGKRMIGVVGGTGLPGMRYTDRLPYFTSGIAYPDWTVFSTDVLTKGTKAIEAAGFFGNGWQFDAKESAFLGKE